MSTMRITVPSHHIDIAYHARLSGAQRMAGVTRAGQALGASAAQAFGAMCALPLLATGAPLWLGLRAASNFYAGLSGLGHAVSGMPSAHEAVDEALVAALCHDVLAVCEAGSARRGCEAAAQLLEMPSLDLGAWGPEVLRAACIGVECVVADALARAQAASREGEAREVLWETHMWLRDFTARTKLPLDVRFGAFAQLRQALLGEQIRWRLNDMEGAVGAEDWHAARDFAEQVVTAASGAGFDEAARRAQAVRERAALLLGHAIPTFDALEHAARATAMDSAWRMRQIAEARILLGPADDPRFETLADEIVATFNPPQDIDHPRIIHARLPSLFYHPERNRHGPYIKLVPQAMLAAFGDALRRDRAQGGLSAQRTFFAEGFVDGCFEGRGDGMMAYLQRYPLDKDCAPDMEAVLDLRPDMDDEARATEHFRVFSVVQLRRFALARGINPRDADAFAPVRASLEASEAFTRDYCNVERFTRYLQAQDFVRAQPDGDAVAVRLVAYVRDVVGVL